MQILNMKLKTLVLLILLVISSCTHNKSGDNSEYGPATRDLIRLVENNPDVRAMLELSIEKAQQINPDKNTNPVRNLKQYYSFVSSCEKAMPWALLKRSSYPEIFDHIFQSLRLYIKKLGILNLWN